MTKKIPLIAAASLIAFPTLAMAHPGHGMESGLGEGLMHPLTGLDHLLAIAAIALLAVRAGGRAMWAIPAAFVACGIVGGTAAWASNSVAGSAMPWVEAMIVASVALCGVLLVRRESVSVVALSAITMFGVFHGYAHIHELGQATGIATYSVGILAATIAMLGTTIGAGVMIQSLRSRDVMVSLTRAVGCSLVVAAAAMLLV